VCELLARASTAPVYALSDTFLGIGVVGGYVVSWAKAGELTADAARQIMLSTALSDVITDSSGINRYMFDWAQLKR
jgi:hypothetical protein